MCHLHARNIRKAVAPTQTQRTENQSNSCFSPYASPGSNNQEHRVSPPWLLFYWSPKYWVMLGTQRGASWLCLPIRMALYPGNTPWIQTHPEMFSSSLEIYYLTHWHIKLTLWILFLKLKKLLMIFGLHTTYTLLIVFSHFLVLKIPTFLLSLCIIIA